MRGVVTFFTATLKQLRSIGRYVEYIHKIKLLELLLIPNQISFHLKEMAA